MTKFACVRFFLLILIVSPAYGQKKVKYKDIFALLSTKQYEQAEPFLRKYLKDNDDEPSAYLFMGITFQEKALKTDVLKQTKLAISYMDSAMLNYDLAYKIMDEREVRKNKEYYASYNRRDLRTSEFGIKLSDIQFDLEKRKEFLKERIDKSRMVKHYFTLSDSLYKKSNALYRKLHETYPTERQLYLQADEKTIADLKTLSIRFDSCTKAFDNYKTNTSNLGKTGYNQNFNVNEITEYEKQGIELADFYQDDLNVWDYKKFADKNRNVIEKEIFPMREHLITYDIEINKLRDKLNTDSVSVRSALTKLIDKLLYEQLKKFDPNPLPMEVFSLKTADLEYRSILLENKAHRDSADVHLRITMINGEVKSLNKLDSIATKLSSEDIDQKSQDYNHFVTNTYSNTIVLKSYIKALKEYADRERRQKDADLAHAMKIMDWIVDGADSIPLLAGMANSYKPLFTQEEKFTLGVHVIDSTHSDGYFYTINAARRPEVKVIFPVDQNSFKERLLTQAKGLSYSDASGQIFFVAVYSQKPNKDKYPVTLAKIYRSDGLAWSNNYQLPFMPKEISLRQDTGEITLKSDAQVTVIDKNGKQVK